MTALCCLFIQYNTGYIFILPVVYFEGQGCNTVHCKVSLMVIAVVTNNAQSLAVKRVTAPLHHPNGP